MPKKENANDNHFVSGEVLDLFDEILKDVLAFGFSDALENGLGRLWLIDSSGDIFRQVLYSLGL